MGSIAETPELAAETLALLRRLLPFGVGTDGESSLIAAGLESMAAARLVLELHAELGVDVPLEWLSEPGGATALADRVAGLITEDGDGRDATPHVHPDHGDGYAPYELTPMQQAYLIGRDTGFAPDPAGCHLYRDFEVADLDPERLRTAWSRVLERHEMLRAVVTVDGQRIHPCAPGWDLPVGDVPDAGYAARVAEIRDRLTRRRYEPGDWPMWTLEVTRAASGRATVHVSIDALITDGRGLDLLLTDWWHYYHRPGDPLPGPEVTVHDCVRRLLAHRGTLAHARDLEYWRERLANLPPGPRITVPAGPAGTAGHPRCALTADLSPEEWRALRELAGAWEVSPTSLVLTQFAEALAHDGDGAPFSLVLTVSDRSRLPAASDVIAGPFTSSMIFRVPATGGLGPGAAAAEVHRLLWADLAHAAVGGVEVLRALRKAPHLPVVFTSMIDSASGAARAGFADAPGHSSTRTGAVAVEHQMWERDGALRLHWNVADGPLPPGRAQTLFARFVNSLRLLTTEDSRQRGEGGGLPLNPLQQSYIVARTAGDGRGGEGCQLYHAFEVTDLDLPRLEDAWLRLVAGYRVLRTTITVDCRARVRPSAPRAWQIPVLPGAADGVADDMLGHAFPLGRGLHAELRVSEDAGTGTATVHIAIDLAVADARSAQLLMRELWRFYAAPGAEPRPVLDAPEPPSSLPQGQRDHWCGRLSELPPRAPLPSDSGTGGGGERRTARLETRLWNWPEVKETLRDRGLDPDAMLLALFADALAVQDAGPFALSVVRWPASGEPYRPGEQTGLSWVPYGDPAIPAEERCRSYQVLLAADAEADERAGVAGGGLTELRRVAARRGAGYPVVYTGVFDLSDRPLPCGVAAGSWRTRTPGVSLDCVGADDGEVLTIGWDATSGDFPEGWLEAAFNAFERGLKSLGAGGPLPEPGISPARELASPPRPAAGEGPGLAERRAALMKWNDTAQWFPADGPAHALFERQARERPSAVALRWRGGTMTYAELNRWANRIAWRLRDLGVGPEAPVAISIRRGPAMVAAVFGVLKAGGLYVPMEPHLPAERAAAMLTTTGAATLLTTSDTEGLRPPSEIQVVRVDREPVLGEPGGPRDTDPPPVTTPDDTAYVIFTSGSTGEPKGVAVTHRPVLNLLDWCRRDFGFGPADVGLCVTSLGFDLSVFDILGLLGYGAGLYIADDEQRRDPELLLDILLTEPVTFWNSAPAALNQLAPLLPGRAGQPGTGELRLVFLSGDYTPLPLPDTLRAVFRDAEIVSLGGATEATVWSNYFRVGEVDPEWRSIPYGRPVANSRYYILDDRLEPCPPGVEGDLFIGGDCLATGYFGRPGLTAERFVADPYALRPGGLMYRTGDRAAWEPDGLIWFLGRSDHQVKVRGYRVEPGEIEHRLRRHDGVRDAVVLARSDPSGDHRLVAYVQPAGLRPPSAAELRAFAARTLPDYMVPNLVCHLDAFPVTANGKLDRNALPWPLPADPGRLAEVEPTATARQADEAAPGPAVNELCEEIAELFAGFLGVPSVDPDIDLWDQGATSFTITQVSAELQKRHRRRVPVSALLAEPTVSAIARSIAAEAVHAEPARPEPSEAAQPAPCEPSAVEREDNERPPEPVVSPIEIEFFSPDERAEFKAAGLAERSVEPGDRIVPLGPVEFMPEFYRWRGTHRRFTGGPASRAGFERLLALLRSARVDGRDRRLYPSAGDTYAVQVYVHVRAGGVEGLDEGLYYYRPAEHRLERIAAGPGPGRSAHFYYNRPVFDRAGFELYLVGQTRGIEPLYGRDAGRYLALEAGYMGQLLMMGQAACDVGLCPIGIVNFEPLRRTLRLDEGHRFLQQFLGGVPAQPAGSASTGEPPFFSAAEPKPLNEASHHTAPVVSVASGDTRPGPEGISVIGVAVRFPGAADLGAYWRNLSGGVTSLGEMPAGRPGAGIGLIGGFLDDPGAFEAELFHIAPAEARLLDPQLRLLLRVVWECLEDAGYTAAALRRVAPRVGVFTGVMWHDHRQAGADDRHPGELALVTALGSDIPNRISHFFDFQGPSIAVDTSCSSSLTALHLAAESLRSGECDAAVVTGVNLVGHPYHLEVLSDLGVLAPDGGRGAFDAGSNGWPLGEGAGAVLLRPAAAADRDRDVQHGVIEATRIGHAGCGPRYGAPRPQAMAESIGRVLHRAGRDARDIGYVECAAAGASIADAAEIEALAELFAGGPPVPVGTVKPSIGHLESAAGMSQLARVMLQFRHGRLAPTPAGRGEPLMDWDGLPLRLVDRLETWSPVRPGAPLRALINAAGATGTYAHVLLRSAPGPAR